ncbi:MAG: hypothetical protein OSJ66_07570 [Clostridia bacterium]|nr:hypothetical protein [Clostridia bacterium]
MKKKKYSKTFIDKSKNNTPIRVLYKKTGQPPETRIIDNVFKLKKAIVKKNLTIIPYENLYIICNNIKFIQNEKANIILTFSSIYGDLILVDIDKKSREFKGLSQEDIIWYSQDLLNKTCNTTLTNTKKNNKKDFSKVYERDTEREHNSKLNVTDFEKALITVLINIEMTLSTLLGNGDKK